MSCLTSEVVFTFHYGSSEKPTYIRKLISLRGQKHAIDTDQIVVQEGDATRGVLDKYTVLAMCVSTAGCLLACYLCPACSALGTDQL